MQPYYEPGSVAQPETPRPAPVPSSPDAVHIAWASDGTNRAPQVNLLEPNELAQPEPVPEAAAPTAVAASPSDVAKPKRRHRALMVGMGVFLLLVGVSAAYAFLVMKKPVSAPVAKASPVVTPSVTPTPSPTATPTPTPVPTSEPLTITAPTVTPTSDHPQTVTITSNSGLWLRSSPTSVNRNNIIGWMPEGAQVSVDQEGDFWWHGTYRGQPGYFASKYTQ